VVYQIFDSDPDRLLQAALRLQERGPNIIDVNMGCSDKSVSGRGAGAGLLREPEKIARIFHVLHKMVTVMKGGEEVKISKRHGGYVTLRDLIDWTSRDAVRFFLISRKADTEFVFDVDLAVKASDENPVFYVQYAHARICSVLAEHARRGGAPADTSADLALLTAPTEQALMLKLAAFPDMLAAAAADMAPHDIAFYLRDLAAAFHSYYAAERFLVDDPALARSRMALLAATRQVLRNALDLLGVSAPDAMSRDPATPEASA
jgi:arginyl-tRNA synthetase